MLLVLAHHGDLLSSEPETDDEPDGRERRGDERNSRHAEADPAHRRKRPCADLIACAVDEGVYETLGLVLVLAAHDREEDFARGTGYGEVSGATERQEDD